ncbi:MAG: amidohydrolase family protein [Novosphingobium sp.]|nr:amidohydrolase family protein [Novosphingobium sp.]
MTAETLTKQASDTSLETMPWIISVDDHVTEPPDLWSTRLPQKFKDRGPQVKRDKILVPKDAREGGTQFGHPDGVEGDYWIYDGKPCGGMLTPITHAVGFDEKKIEHRPMTYDEIHPGSWQQAPRLADMTSNHVEASMCFCNTLSGFGGQLYLREPDKELGLACIQAYNDWMIDDWCGGEGKGRLIPLILLPLWDPLLCAEEVRRCAAKGAIAASFLENPYELDLPSLYTGAWDPLFQACDETRTNLSMHIGSSPKIPTTSEDAPYMMTSIIMFIDSMTSALDFLLAGVFERFPNLKIAYSEGQIGWLPYAVRRADKVWAARDKEGHGYQRTPNPPSSYVKGHVYGCIFDDDTALLSRDLIGMSQIMMEVDYPHSACAFPNVVEVANGLADIAGLNDTERHMLFRGNAIEAYGLERMGIKP